MTGIYAENADGQFKKAILEAASYAATIQNGPITAICVGSPNASEAEKLAQYGVEKLIVIEGIQAFDAQQYAQEIAKVAKDNGLSTLVFANTYEAKSLAPRVAVHMDAAFASNVIAYPDNSNGFVVKRSVFSGKGYAYVKLENANKIIALTPNSTDLISKPCSISVQTQAADAFQAKTKIESTHKSSGKIPLTEAEIVVSAGRGMKGPENWGMVEDLAQALGAATACSKPVSDMGWRPHSEHVGQTGITIKPNLYIAIGISGAIQHLAGVSSSKVIVAINKDPEAPFFKAADYGIVGDAFEVLPQLLSAAKA